MVTDAKTLITYWGHSFVSLRQGEQVLAIDPYYAQGEIPFSFCPTLVLVTHGHNDHLGQAVPLAKRAGCDVLAITDLARYLRTEGASTQAAHFGGKLNFPFGWVKIVPAIHSSTGPQGQYLGEPAGFLIQFFDRLFYHAGDTALFSDMALFKLEGKVFCAFLPIGGLYTMDPADALRAVRLIEPSWVIPIHFNSFPQITQDVAAFAQRIEDETSSRCRVMAPGEALEL
jgi:L-ascorbate metabolism protein UlaG (beta-lactamase superfamily)